MSENIISLQSICKSFICGEIETKALNLIDLNIKAGDYVVINGPSGCGKSTLLSVLGLLDKADSGQYLLNNIDVSLLPVAERVSIRNKHIGFIFQAFNLIGDLTVLENVELPLLYRSGIASSIRRTKALEVLERVGMSHRINHYPSQLSGGQQQRVAVARALVGSPKILLADEPTGNLDSQNASQVMSLLTDLHRDGTTICMVTHDARYKTVSTKQVHLLDGQIVQHQKTTATQGSTVENFSEELMI